MPATAAPVSTTCASSPPGQGHSGIAMPAEFKKYTKAYEKNIRASLPQGHCTSANIAKRKSWYVVRGFSDRKPFLWLTC